MIEKLRSAGEHCVTGTGELIEVMLEDEEVNVSVRIEVGSLSRMRGRNSAA